MGVPIVYVLHEPFMGIENLLKEKGYITKAVGATALNYWICLKSDKIILCSYYAEQNCKIYMKNAYKKRILFPLIYPDDFMDTYERKYFSQTSHTENIPYALINQLELNVESHSRTLLCTQTTHPKSGQIVQESFQERFDQQDF